MSKSEQRQKDKVMHLRWHEDELDTVTQKAIQAGMTRAKFIRHCALGKRIHVRTDLNMQTELLRQGGLLKHLHNEMKTQMTTELSKQFSETLNTIKTAVAAIELDIHPATGPER